MVQQIMPRFVLQRDLYEVRERPSKAYSWVAFIIANILVEIPYQILLGIMVFASYYYPIYTLGGFQSSQRQGLILLYCIQLFIFSSTYAHLLIAALPDAETAARISTLLFSLILTFNGVFQPPQALPGFWIFMYRVSPLTYLVSGIVSTGLHDRKIVCADRELAVMQPPPGMSCGAYLQKYASAAHGQIINASAMSNCEYCPLDVADQQLSRNGIEWSQRWRNFGIVWAYIIFNIFGAVMLYYLFRVRKSSGRTARLVEKVKGMVGGKKEKGEKVEHVEQVDEGAQNGTKEVAAEPRA
jgi:ABC-type multidrug transport system permease subunit